MAGKSSSKSEIGIVSSPRGAASGGGPAGPSGAWPTGWSATAISFCVSRSSSRSTVSSEKPATTLEGSPSAEQTASELATMVPESQKAWRYSRAWYLQALRQTTSV